MTIRNCVWALLLALASGCSRHDRASSQLAAAGSTCVNHGPDSLLSSWVAIQDSVDLRLPDSVLLANPSRVLRNGFGLIAVLDEMEYNIKLFDRSGAYLRTIGRRGTGPGEIGRLSSAAFVDDSTLLIPDGRRGRVIRYRIDGTLLTDTVGTAGAIGGAAFVESRVGIGVYVRPAQGARDSGQLTSIQWIATTGGLGESSNPVPATHQAHPNLLSRPPLVGGVSGAASSQALLTWGWSDSIYLVGASGRIIHAAPLTNSEHFQNATTSAEALDRASLGTMFQGNTPILDLAGFEDKFVLSSIAFSGNTGVIWYRILGHDLSPLVVDLRSDMRLFPGTSAGLVGLRARMDSVRQELIYSVLTVRPCS